MKKKIKRKPRITLSFNAFELDHLLEVLWGKQSETNRQLRVKFGKALQKIQGTVVCVMLALLSGCSYISNTAMYVSGEKVKVNPITRGLSGEKINMKIERQTDAQLIFPNKPKNFKVNEPEPKFWILEDDAGVMED